MNRRPSSRLADARTALWHLRKGGAAQLAQWRERRRVERVERLRAERLLGSSIAASDVPAWPVDDRERRGTGLTAAVIMDTFSARAWGYEFELLELTPGEWREQLAARPVDLLLVESAWGGSNGAWRFQLTGSKAPSDALRELVQHCREQGIPSAFWNKEDPPHFEDFLDTARLFDRVYTTDAALLPSYREALGHDRVDVLGFAAQPALHNPIRQPAVHQVREIGFGGSYWSHKFPERREQMDLLLGAAASVADQRGVRFDIYSRFENDPKYRFPERFQKYVRGSLDYEQMLTAYRMHSVMLNVNSVVDSPTMMARRVFEILASGTAVVTTRSPAVEYWFAADEITIVDEEQEAEFALRGLLASPELRDRQVHRAQRRIWREHTFAARAHQVVRDLSISTAAERRAPQVSVLAPTIRPDRIGDIIANAARQERVDVQLVLLAHGFEPDEDAVRGAAREAGVRELILLRGERDASLGANLNRLVAASDGDVLAKFDDDDHYGHHYLEDAAHALEYSGADLVGKQARYTYLAAMDALVLQFPDREHRWTELVGGPTMVGPRATFEATPFEDRTLGEDTAFQGAIRGAGGRIYAADRFGFVQVRGMGSGHTWHIEDERVLANGRVHGFGLAVDHVDA